MCVNSTVKTRLWLRNCLVRLLLLADNIISFHFINWIGPIIKNIGQGIKIWAKVELDIFFRQKNTETEIKPFSICSFVFWRNAPNNRSVLASDQFILASKREREKFSPKSAWFFCVKGFSYGWLDGWVKGRYGIVCLNIQWQMEMKKCLNWNFFLFLDKNGIEIWNGKFSQKNDYFSFFTKTNFYGCQLERLVFLGEYFFGFSVAWHTIWIRPNQPELQNG